ncbi:MAG: hypothetical protein KF773_31915 [Deltaproteobacteria bacterium]|nr:hypothetical protein [Deltaproteobacteria bacterium]
MTMTSRSFHALVLAAALGGCSKSDGTEGKDPATKASTADTDTADQADKAGKAKPTDGDKKPGVRKARKAGDDTADTADTQVAPKPAKVDEKATRPGPAYIGVEGSGLVRVDGAKVKTIIPYDYPFYDLVIDPRNGTLYASAISALWEVKGDVVSKLPQPDDIHNVEKLALGPDGVLWGLGHGGVARRDGKGWTREPAKTFEDALLSDIAVDRGGRVWVVTTSFIWRLDGDKWKRIDNKLARDQPFWKTVIAGPAGEVYLSGNAGTFVYEGDAWRKLTLSTGILQPDELAVGPDGRLAASGGLADVSLAAPGTAAKGLDLKSSAIKAKQLDVMAVDGAGRTWIRSDNGVVILDGDGALLQQWRPGTVAGINGKVQAIAVAGAGPELPELKAAAKGAIAGKVIHNGKAVAGAVIEICASPGMMFRTSPCGDAIVSHRATSAADGTFTIPDVAVGSYGFAIKPRAKWLVFLGGGGCCEKLENGQTYDVGAITLERLE